jgi:hypothetical protein
VCSGNLTKSLHGAARISETIQRKRLAFYKTLFYYCWTLTGGLMKETHVFKGVKLTEKQVRFVQAMADKSFEGNFSMALRTILAKTMKDAK